MLNFQFLKNTFASRPIPEPQPTALPELKVVDRPQFPLPELKVAGSNLNLPKIEPVKPVFPLVTSLEIGKSFVKDALIPGLDQLLRTTRAGAQLASTPVAYGLDRVQGGDTVGFSKLAQENFELAKKMFIGESFWGENIQKVSVQYLKNKGYEKLEDVKLEDIAVLSSLAFFHFLGDPFLEATAFIRLFKGVKEAALFRKVGQIKKVLPPGTTILKPRTVEIPIIKDGEIVLKIKIKPSNSEIVIQGFARRGFEPPELPGLPAGRFEDAVTGLQRIIKNETGLITNAIIRGDDLILNPSIITKALVSQGGFAKIPGTEVTLPTPAPVGSLQPDIPEELIPLAVEARKFDTANEFADALQNALRRGETVVPFSVLESNALRSKSQITDFFNQVREIEATFQRPAEILPIPKELEPSNLRITKLPKKNLYRLSGTDIQGRSVKVEGNLNFINKEKELLSGVKAEQLEGLAKVNPMLFRRAKKATNVEEFIEAVVRADKTTREKVSIPALTDFFNQVKAGQLEAPTAKLSAGERASAKAELETLIKKDVDQQISLPKGSTKQRLSQVEKIQDANFKKLPPNDRAIKDTITKDHIELPAETKWQAFRRTVEDFNLRLRVLNTAIERIAGAALPEHLDLYALKDMLPRKQADLMRRIEQEKIDFVKDMIDKDVTVSELDSVLHAQHAKERNVAMNEKRVAIGRQPQEGLSGMTDAEADVILAKFQPVTKELEPLAVEARKFDTVEEFLNNNVIEIPLKKVRTFETTDPRSFDDLTRVTTSKEPIKLKYTITDDTFTIIDGNTRIRQAIKNGDETIKANIGFWREQDLISFFNQAKASRPEIITLADKARKIAEDTLQFELDNGLVTQKEFDSYVARYKNYVPLFREVEPADFTGIGQGVSVTGKESKAAYGSTKRAVSPLGNIFFRKQRALIRNLKNDVGKAVIEATKEFPFLEDIFKIEEEPLAVVARAQRTAEIDTQFFEDLVGLAKKLGLKKFVTLGQAGRRLGVFHPGLSIVERKFATSRETTAHEIGHFFDNKYNLRGRFYRNRKVSKEVGQEIFEHSAKEVGESSNRLSKVEERFANAFSWWLLHRDLATKTMPLFNKEIRNIINEFPELKPLLKIKPTAQPQLERFTEDIWGKVFRFGDNVIGAKIDGKQNFITIKDDKIAKALKNLELARVPSFVRLLRSALSVWSGFKTRWRPEFLLTNFERDLGEAIINLNVEKALLKDKGRGLRKDVVKGLFKSQKQIWDFLRGKSDIADEFFRLGGNVGHFWLETAQKTEKSMLQLEKELRNIGSEKVKNPIRKFGDLVDHAQTMVELGVRFSTWKELVKRGVSKQKATNISADLTLNFARQGEISPFLKSFFGFINPAIQGTSKAFRTIASKAGRGRVARTLFGLMALGFLTRTISLALDEEGDEQINDWAKNHKLTFAIGNGKQITLWNMPYGYSVFYAIGSNGAEWVHEKKTEREVLLSLIESAVTSFSPFETDLKAIIPTLAKPLFEIQQNEGWYKGKIHPEQVFTKTPKPNFRTYFDNTAKPMIWITELLNKMTGGSEDKSGLIDISPDDLEYLYDQWFGGPFEFLTSSAEAVAKGFGGEFDVNKTPFVRQFIRQGKPQQFSYGVIYDTLERAWKKDLNDLEKTRFYRAVSIGLKEEVFDRDRANSFIRDFLKAQYKMLGNIQDNAEAIINMPAKDRDLLLETYSEQTRSSIIKSMKEFYFNGEPEEDIKPEAFEAKSESGFIDRMVLYARAIGTDPVTAFNRIFTGQRIRKLENGAIIVERLPVEESQGIKRERGATQELRLDHTMPLQLGGSNSEKNLKLVPVEVWERYTIIENFLGDKLRSGDIKKREAQKLIRDFKAGKITEEEVRNFNQ